MKRGLSLAGASILATVLVSSCGDEPRTIRLVRLVPDAAPACGAPLGARTLRVEAIGDFPPSDRSASAVEIGLDEALQIDAFPTSTRALEVQVLGAQGLLAIGRSEEFDGETLADGGEISVFMSPPNGVCPTGPPARARSGALAAVTGDRVVIVGGVDAAGRPVSRPEVYLSREARFEEIPQDLYGDVESGLVGASLTPLSDGRIALIGGGQNAFQVYTADAGQFSEPPLLLQQPRAFHAAVALDDEQVFLAGGCTMLEDAACVDGTEAITTAILQVTTGALTPGPSLSFVRVGARAFLEPDGRVIVVGGSFAGAPVLSAERIDPQGRQPNETLSGAGLIGVRLASGAIVTAFGTEEAPTGDGTAFAPGGTNGGGLVPALSRAEPTLTALESGQVLAFGGAGGAAAALDEAALYEPLSGRWTDLSSLPVETRRRHASARLPDGSVLIVGGEQADGTHLGDALIFRPALLGPLTGSVTINFADESAEQLVARDRGAMSVVPAGGGPAYLEMTARDTDEGIPGEWAIVAAPVLASSNVELTASAPTGFAVLSGFEEPTTFRVTLVLPDTPISVLDVQAGSVQPVPGCTSEAAPTATLSATTRWRHEVTDDGIRLLVDDTVLLDCETDIVRSGRVGVGPLGPTEGSARLFQLSVSR